MNLFRFLLSCAAVITTYQTEHLTHHTVRLTVHFAHLSIHFERSNRGPALSSPLTGRYFFENQIITEHHLQCGYSAEDKGTGFMTILNASVDSPSPSPKTDNSPGIFSISFEKRKNNLQKIDFRKHPEDAILDELDSRDSLSISELIDLSGLSRTAVCNHIKKLVRSGKIEPIEPPRSPKQRYRLVR